jgi:hypothetical protein
VVKFKQWTVELCLSNSHTLRCSAETVGFFLVVLLKPCLRQHTKRLRLLFLPSYNAEFASVARV